MVICPKFGPNIKTDVVKHTYRGCVINYIMEFSRESRAGFPSWSKHGLGKQGKKGFYL